jgi:membrane-bound lytic murein transglycosylase B
LLSSALVTTGVVLLLTIGVARPDEPPAPPKPTFVVEPQRPQPGAAVPRTGLAAPQDRPKLSDQAELDAWAEKVSAATQVPARVLAAYGRAEMWMRAQKPTCQLSWATLAGIGRVESGHGDFGGADVGSDGQVTMPILGPVLNGSPGLRAVPDTDGGKLDGDTRWDRAIGPMQVLPATWKRWAERASGDGAKPDPQNVDDSAFTAARYLCSAGDDLSTPAGWWKAVLAYNQSTEYAQDVFSGSDAYAAASLTP